MRTAKLLFLCCLLASNSILSKTSDSLQPIQVEADNLEIRESDNISIYSGNVQLTQGSLEIYSDLLTLYFDDNKVLTLIKMSGSPATLRQLDDNNLETIGKGLEIEYQKSEAMLLLLGDAKLTQGIDTIESNKISLNTKTNRIEAGSVEPNNRVRVLIPSRQPDN